MRNRINLFVTCCTFMACAALAAAQAKVEIKKAEGKDQYDVTLDGKPFTSYCFNDKEFSDKPVFWPVLSPKGTQVNRGIPPAAGEPTDHPHHQSLWFDYGDVNGVDYWNLQFSGRRIKQRETKIEGAALHGILDWIDPKGIAVLEEHKMVQFGGAEGVRWMDHDITLTARGTAPVDIGDSKEGAFGIRVAKGLQGGMNGGKYTNAEGKETEKQVWGKTSPWMALAGTIGENEDVTVAIFSHPSTVNHPPYWHSRDYGLFAVNPFGRKSYDKTQEERHTVLQPGQSVHLRFRFLVYSGKVAKDRLDKDYADFAK